MFTAKDIAASLMSPELKLVAGKILAGTATALDISGANIDLAEKTALMSAFDGSATEEAIHGAAINPVLKSAILASPYITLTGVAATATARGVTAT